MAIYGTQGDDTLTGTATGDFIYGYPDGTATPDAETGNDSIRGGAGNDRLYGGGGNDTLRGEDGFDQMIGGAGNDVLQDGGTGLDYFDGGDGDDLFLVSGSGNDTFLGGAGSDRLQLEGDVTWTRLTLDSAASVETLDLSAGHLRGTEHNDTFDLSGVDQVILGGRAIEMGSGNNIFIGHAGADHVSTSGGFADFSGGAGNDTLRAVGSLVEFDGGEGNDLLLLSGYGWIDTIIGGAGTDTVRLDGAAERHHLIFDAASGVERFYRAGFALVGTDYDDIFDFSGLSQFGTSGPMIDMGIGSDTYIGWAGRDSVAGGAGADLLNGGRGADYLDGGSGIDTLIGGFGNDRYVVDRANDVVDEEGGDGIDTVYSSVTLSLAASATMRGEVEHLVLTGTAAINGFGNGLDNRMTGNVAANILRGGGGSDTLSGGGGDDVLVGGSGGDRLLGGAGHDRLDGGTGGDRMIGGTGNDIYVVDSAADQVVERAGQGVDTVLAFVDTTLAANVETLILQGAAVEGRGNDLDNRIVGTAQDNRLFGGGGNDTMAGGDGHDVLSGGDGNDAMAGEAGNDTLIGGTGNDVLNGGAGADRLAGGEGRDRLTGAAGQDVLSGDAGADVFVFDQAPLEEHADRILDFSAAEGDRLLLEADIFVGLGSGALDPSRFVAGTVAAGAYAQILYEQETGRLWYDADGAGDAEAQLIAVLDNLAGLEAQDILLI